MHLRLLRVGLLLASVMAFPNAFSQKKKAALAPTPAQRLADFDAFAQKVLADWNAPGCGVAVVVKDKVVFAKGYGFRDLEKKRLVTPQTLFRIASNTKLITATGAGLLVEEGKLDWDKPVRTYAPTLQFFNDELNRTVTLRDLLAHRTGISRHDGIWYGADFTLQKLAAQVRNLEPSLPPRQEFLYNNMMYYAAGAVVEQVAGQPWEEFTRQRIFEPLGMNATLFDDALMLRQPDFAQSYHEKRDTTLLLPIPFIRKSVYSAGAVVSNLDDLSHWLIAQLNGGKWQGKQVIPARVIGETMTPAMPVKNNGMLTKGYTELLTPVYGMGRYTASYRGHYVSYHGGALDGVFSQVSMMPYDSIGVIAFVNAAHGRPIPDILVYGVYDRLLGLPPVPWSDRALADFKKAKRTAREARKKADADRVANTKPSHPLTDYAGTFEHPAYGQAVVTESGGKLALTFHEVTLPLEHYHYDRFQTPDDEVYGRTVLLYETNAQGDLDKVRIPLDEQEATFTRKPDARLSEPAFLTKLTGSYELNGTVIRVTERDGRLQLLQPGQPPYDLEPYRGTAYRLKQFSDVTVEFAVPDAATGLKVKDSSGEVTFSRKN